MKRNWKFGLRLRLAAGFIAILALSTGAVSLFTGYVAQREVDRIQAHQDRVRAGRLNAELARFYDNAGDWHGVQEFIVRAGLLSGREVVVLDADGNVVGDSRQWRHSRLPRRHHDRREEAAHNAHAHLPPPDEFTPLYDGENRVGAALVIPRERPDAPPGAEEPRLAEFAEAVNDSLTIAGLAAGVAGILLVVLLSRRTLGAIGSLTAAARALGGGDLARRVEVKGGDEIAELGHAFNAMAEALQDAERQRRSLVADVAHELRTPLANIQGHVEAIQDGLIPADDAALETLHRQAGYLTRLVNDLRLLAQSEARELRLDMGPAAADELVERVAASFRPRAEAGAVRLVTEVAPGLPPLNIDRLRIEQALGNLTDNALGHTPAGGTVAIAAVRHGQGVRITVSDTGAGIPAEALPYVFDRLYRVDPSRDRATGGAGLGLTIARQLVKAHGGDIWAESVPGAGSRFGFDLPGAEFRQGNRIGGS